MRISNTSAQLKALAAAGLLTSRRSGTRVYYRVADDEVAAFVEQMKDLALARLDEAERAAHDYLGDVESLEPVEATELARRVDTGEAVILDVRPAEEYAAGHIPGALSVPHDRLAGRLIELVTELPPDAEIVAYCRGRYCVMAPEAVRLLRDHGCSARPLDGGLLEWRRAGRRVEVTSAGAAK